jgi:segregation and condensation protein A
MRSAHSPHEFNEPAIDAIDAEDQLIVDLAGFEGPLDLLLALARTRKLDLSQVSMLALAQQYLGFIDAAAALRLELAADYLVMAAWLTYLKSRLLLSKEQQAADEPAADELAAALAFRLQRLEAMRRASQLLMQRPQLGRDVFARGVVVQSTVIIETRLTADLHDLVAAYAARRRRMAPPAAYAQPQRQVWSIKEARERLTGLLGLTGEWTELNQHLSRWFHDAPMRRTALASSLGAVLELARSGSVEIRQSQAFGPIYLRPRSQEPEPDLSVVR